MGVVNLTSLGTGGGNAVIGNNAANSTLTINNDVLNDTFGGTIGGTGTNNNNINIIKTGALTQTFSGFNYLHPVRLRLRVARSISPETFTAIGTTVNVQN